MDPYPRQRLLERSGPGLLSPDVRESDAEAGRGSGRRLRCAACGGHVTEETARMSVDGASEHRFTNPAGIRYEISCFRHAPGCAATGRPTLEHTWFSGYHWEVGLCRSCGVHLGWRYTGGAGEVFFGLIAARLAPEQ